VNKRYKVHGFVVVPRFRRGHDYGLHGNGHGKKTLEIPHCGNQKYANILGNYWEREYHRLEFTIGIYRLSDYERYKVIVSLIGLRRK